MTFLTNIECDRNAMPDRFLRVRSTSRYPINLICICTFKDMPSGYRTCTLTNSLTTVSLKMKSGSIQHRRHISIPPSSTHGISLLLHSHFCLVAEKEYQINVWTMGVILAPHLSPFVFGFLVARITWRWAYWIGCLYGLFVLILIVWFLKES